MRFPEIFAGGNGPYISFEVFPPKTDEAMERLGRVVPRLVALRPAYMTVTYGALGSTRDRTVEIATRILREHGMRTACHLTCVGSTVAEIDGILDQIEGAGIENIVALRGDPPRGETSFVPPEGGFAHANELVAHIHARDRFGIAVAGYPEKHLEAPDMESDLRFLKQKVDAGGDVVITQLFYDNRDFFRFAEQAREIGVRVPIVPGLLPIQSFKQIQKIAGLCGARIPDPLQRQLEAAGEDTEKVREVGTRWATEQSRELLRRGAPGIHFYVLNRASHMERIIGSLRAEGLVP